MTNIEWLGQWAKEKLNGHWHHVQPLLIKTVEIEITHQPAWEMRFTLDNTLCFACDHFYKEQRRIMVNRDPEDWVHGFIDRSDKEDEAGIFKINCGLGNLDEALGYIRAFIEDVQRQREQFILEEADRIRAKENKG